MSVFQSSLLLLVLLLLSTLAINANDTATSPTDPIHSPAPEHPPLDHDHLHGTLDLDLLEGQEALHEHTAMDVDKDGHVTLEEIFHHYVSQYRSWAASPSDDKSLDYEGPKTEAEIEVVAKEEAEHAFAKMDQDNDGVVSALEMKDWYLAESDHHHDDADDEHFGMEFGGEGEVLDHEDHHEDHEDHHGDHHEDHELADQEGMEGSHIERSEDMHDEL